MTKNVAPGSQAHHVVAAIDVYHFAGDSRRQRTAQEGGFLIFQVFCRWRTSTYGTRSILNREAKSKAMVPK